MRRTWWQKSPLTSSTSAPARRRGSSACQVSSCRANGYMQAVVLPVPTAPTTRMPVYSPFSGTTSQDGRALSVATVGWCSSPTTSDGASSVGELGQSGSCPRAPRPLRGWSQTRETESMMLPARSTATPGARKCQRWIARCRPGSWWAIRSRYGLPPGPGNGATNARQASAVSANPMRTSVHGVIGPTPFPEGSMLRERPLEGGGASGVKTHSPLRRTEPSARGVAPVTAACSRAAPPLRRP